MNTPTQQTGGESATPRTDKSHNAIAARLADQWCRCTKQADNTQEYLVQLVEAALEESAAVGQTYYDHLFKRYDELERETATLHAQIARMKTREGELVGALKATLDAAQAAHSHLARISSPDTAWEHPLMRANRAALESARTLLQSLGDTPANEGRGK